MDQEESSIERLKRNLYSRDENIVPKEKRTPVSPRENTAPTTWGTAPSFDLAPETMAKPNNSFFNKFLVGSLIFFFAALGIALFIFFGGLNMISSNNLDIQIVAPSSVSSGEELSIGLTVVNGNRTDLEGAVLYVEYPEGAKAVSSENNALTREKVELGVVENGASKDHVLRAVLFGEKDAVKTFTFRIEYKVKGSNAVFSKEKTYDVVIGSSPLLLEVSYPKEVNSGQEVTLSIDLSSNSSTLLRDVLVKVEYPYGFTYSESSMTPLQGNNIWSMGDLQNSGKKTLVIKGTLVGQNLEDRSFRISAGTRSSPSIRDIDATLAASVETIGIRKSFYGLVVSSTETPKFLGGAIPVTIAWQNTLTDRILNNEIEAVISGNVFDRTQVTVGNGGFYRSVDNTVAWDKNSGSGFLGSIGAGEEGQVFLSVGSLNSNAQTRGIKNPNIQVKVTIRGDRTGTEAGEVFSSETLTVKLSSLLTLTARSYRSIGSLGNTGPIPPKADQKSTYAIKWTLTNTNNDLRDGVVSATLPVGVTWENQFAPTAERLSYDTETRIVRWEVGNISAGAGFTLSPKEVSFKVGIVPSINQVGTSVVLTSESVVTARDTYTEAILRATNPVVTTVVSDPGFNQSDGNVVR